MAQSIDVDTQPTAVLARALASALTDADLRRTVAESLLWHALKHDLAVVSWSRGARTYEGGAYPSRESAQQAAGGAPVSHFLTFVTRYVPEAELPRVEGYRPDAEAVLHHLLGAVLPDPAERQTVVAALLVKHIGDQPRFGSWTIGWGWGPTGSETGNGSYEIAQRFSRDLPLARKIDIRTRHFHAGD